jgi:hypothetical protein
MLIVGKVKVRKFTKQIKFSLLKNFFEVYKDVLFMLMKSRAIYIFINFDLNRAYQILREIKYNIRLKTYIIMN